MKKYVIGTSVFILFVLGIILGFLIVKINLSETENVEIAQESEENIIDECTEEYQEMIENDNSVQKTSSSTEKISPNCSITFKRYYSDCGHTIEEYVSVPTELVNKTEEDLQQKYEGWSIEEFSRNQIVLYREFDSECGEHYVLRDNDGKVTVYLKEGNSEEIVEETDIATEFLTETDKIELQNGIEVNGRVELNKVIEDFE